MDQITSVDWWRPKPIARPAAADAQPATSSSGYGRFAFRALIAFTFVLVIAPQQQFQALQPLRLALVAGVCAIGAHLMDRLERRVPWRTPVEFQLAGVLLGWTVLSVPFSLWPGGSAALITDIFIKSLVVFWLLGRVVNTTSRGVTLAWTLTLLTVPLALSGIVNFRAGAFVDEGSRRIMGYGTGIASNPNDLALTLAIILPFTLAVFLSERRRLARTGAGVVALLNATVIVLTFSRGGFIALAAIVLLSIPWFVRARAFAPLVVLGTLLVAAPMVLPSGYLERLQTIANVSSDTTHSAQDRLRDMGAAVDIIKDHPLLGVGPGQDVLALNMVRGATWRQVHDVYLEYGVDLGVFGMALFVALLLTCIWTTVRAERMARVRGDATLATLSHGARVSLIAFAVAGFFYPVGYYFYFYYLAGFAVALGAISGSRKS